MSITKYNLDNFIKDQIQQHAHELMKKHSGAFESELKSALTLYMSKIIVRLEEDYAVHRLNVMITFPKEVK